MIHGLVGNNNLIGMKDVPKERKMEKVRHRTTFSDMIVARSGLSSNGQYVFVTSKDGTGRPFKTHIRRVPVIQNVTENNELFRERSRTVSDLWNNINDDFKVDLRIYALVFNSQHRLGKHAVSAYNLFVKVLSSFQSPVFSLLDVTNFIGNNINEWIENGFLPSVNVNISFDHEIIG